MAIAPGLNYWVPLPLGRIRAALQEPLAFQLELHRRFGDVVRFRTGPLLTHFLYHPEHVSHVLREQQKDYLRSWHYRVLKRLLGDGLVSSEGPHWLRQRRLAQPAFQRERLRRYLATMEHTTRRFLANWQKYAQRNDRFDAGFEMSQLALAIAGLTLFSRDVTQHADTVGSSFARISQFLEHRFSHPLTSLPLAVPTPRNLQFRKAADELRNVVLRIVQERRSGDSQGDDLLTMLLEATDAETRERMADEHLCSELMTFLVAGHETTARALTWTLFLLSRNPESQQQVREESHAVLPENGRSLELDVVTRLNFTRQVIEESLRLYPPVWLVARQAVADDVVGGFSIPAGSTVALCPFITHRHQDFWEEPEMFNPDRFGSERSQRIHKGAYFPFLAGPHQCIGNEFAMLEMTLVLALFARHFEIESFDKSAVLPVAKLTLVPSRPIELRLRPLKIETCPAPQAE